MNSLVGFTGFVGSNIASHGCFDGLYNSKNIKDAYGTCPELLIYSGIRAEKFYANNDPIEDLNNILQAFENIKKINPKRLVLISTIDVYKCPINVDEDSVIDIEGLEAYGANRYKLEQMVRIAYPDCLIVRLPGLFGENIKKNFIYDMIHVIPSLLRDKKYEELKEISSLVRDNYVDQGNAFYKCVVKDENKEILKNEFLSLGFSALNFTDSRGVYQFYNLENLWKHIQIALENNIKVLNLATEPVAISEIYKFVRGAEFVNECNLIVPEYNFKSKYSALFGGEDGYLCSKENVFLDIKKFILGEK